MASHIFGISAAGCSAAIALLLSCGGGGSDVGSSDDTAACEQGDTRRCLGPGACDGEQRCSPEGWGDCECAGEETTTTTESFGIHYEMEALTSDVSGLTLTDESGADVTPAWSGAIFMGWSATFSSGTVLEVMLSAPGTGSRLRPGPRWLRLIANYDAEVNAEEVVSPVTVEVVGTDLDSEPGEATVVYVATDDPAEAETTAMWADPSGSIAVTITEAEVTSRQDGFAQDTGTVEATIEMDDLTLETPLGERLAASGSVTARGTKSGSVAVPDEGSGGAPGGTGGAGGQVDCSTDYYDDGLPDDPQIKTQCQAACVYKAEQSDEGVEISCSTLAGFDPSYPDLCPYCP